MTTKKDLGSPDEESRGVLDDAASIDTTSIGIIGGTAQVSVIMPGDTDDELDDEGVIDGEVATLILEEPEPVTAGEPAVLDTSIVIEIAEEEPIAEAAETDVVSSADASAERSAGWNAPEAVSEAPRLAVSAPPVSIRPAAVTEVAPSVTGTPGVPVESPVTPSEPSEQVASEDEVAAAFVARAAADRRPAPTRRAATARTGHSAMQGDALPEESPASEAPRRTEQPHAAKRLGDLGEASRESADLLTADRLLDPSRVSKPEPEGAWSHFLYTISGHRINIGDGRKAKERKALTARIAAPLVGDARFVPVLSRKGGVGKTTITALLGMALSDARDDRVIAVDANPDRGTLADRIVRPASSRSVRDLVRIHDQVSGYHDISAIVARDATRLDVLASDSDPRIAEAFSDVDYRDVAGVAAHYYSLVLTDTGTGIVHSVMTATLDLADQIVIVSGLSVDEARLASETLTWLENNGHTERARDAIIVLNQSNPGIPLVRIDELEAHFRTRAAHVVRMPYDAQIAGGGAIVFANLLPETRRASRELAALLVEGLRARASS